MYLQCLLVDLKGLRFYNIQKLDIFFKLKLKDIYYQISVYSRVVQRSSSKSTPSDYKVQYLYAVKIV